MKLSELINLNLIENVEKLSKGFATAEYWSSEFAKQNKVGWSANHDEIDAALLDQAPNKYVIQDENIIVGAIAFALNDKSVNIEHIGSLKPGVGSILIKKAEDFANRKKLPVTLMPSNIAKSFYEKRGYKLSGAESSQLMVLEPKKK